MRGFPMFTLYNDHLGNKLRRSIAVSRISRHFSHKTLSLYRAGTVCLLTKLKSGEKREAH